MKSIIMPHPRQFAFLIAFFCVISPTTPADNSKCEIYLAKSTIPNAGLGVFTAVDIEENEIIGYGDPAIPIVDIDFHNDASAAKEDYHWLLDDYNWKAAEAGNDMAAEAEKTSAHISGFGSLPNCHMRLKNIRETFNEYDTAGVTRNDPAIGSFTAYHNRRTYSTRSINAGQELFVDYGRDWFLTRESYMGFVPLEQSYPAATSFLEQFHLKGFLEDIMFSEEKEELMSDLWDLIIYFPYKSRPQSALPKKLIYAKKAVEEGIFEAELWQSTRSIDELEKNGKCLDNIRPDNSKIPGAGRGAFATRFLPEGSLVAPAPLLHIPDRWVLNMYGDTTDPSTGEECRDITNLVGRQLLLNYCFGHNSSSILLCPYGFYTAYINHNKSPNTKVIWSTDSMYHNSSILNEPVSYFDNVWNSVVGFDYVALRDIQEGEEISIDYGMEWEDEWNAHVQNWVPQEVHTKPNFDKRLPLKTFDEDETMYGDGIELFADFSFHSMNEGKTEWDEDEFDTDDHKVHRIIKRTKMQGDNEEEEPDYYVYDLDLMVTLKGGSGETALYTVTNVPREAISFYYKQYHSDMFVKGAFRHEMIIPDSMFPTAWRNNDAR